MNRKVVWAVLGIVVVAGAVTGALWWWQNNDHSKLYGRVGSHDVTKAEVQSLAAKSQFTQQQIGDTLMEMFLYEEMAKDSNVTVTDSEVNQELKARTGSLTPQGVDYLRSAIRRDLLRQKLQAAIEGYYKGQFVIANFDRNIAFAGGDVDPNNPVAGRDQRIAADRAYAEQLINSLYDQLNSHKINFDQAIQAELADPKIGQTALPTELHSGNFDTSKTAVNTSYFKAPEIKTVLTSLKAGSFSKPVVGKVATDPSDHPQMADGNFAIIKLDTFVAITGKNFETQAEAKKAQIGFRKF